MSPLIGDVRPIGPTPKHERRHCIDRLAHAQRGMTLLEIMIVITIIGLVTGISSVAYFKIAGGARVDTTRESIRSAETALKLFHLKRGRFPTTSESWNALLTEGVLDKRPRDGWHRELHYTEERGSYVVLSYGSDGELGGDGSATDISSKELE